VKFAIRKKENKKNKQQCFTHVHVMLACRATCDKTVLARPIVSLVPGYQTAFPSYPEIYSIDFSNHEFGMPVIEGKKL